MSELPAKEMQMTRQQIVAAVFAVIALSAGTARADNAPGEFQVPGTESTIKFYGYVQLDTTIDFAGRPVGYENSDWATFLGAVPEDDSAAAKHVKPQTYFTARTSRFGVQTRTPTKIGELGVRLEGDFNGPSGFQSETYTNSVLFRLRQAYATVGGFLVGQTWSNFLDLNAAPDTVDFNGPGTLALVRNPMIRYTIKAADTVSVALALENNRGPQYGVDTRFQSVPDFHANVGWTPSWGTLSARGVVQFFNRARLNGAGSDYADVSVKSKAGLGLAVSGSTKIAQDTLVFQVAGGPGVGRYLLNSATIGNNSPGVSFDNATGNITLWNVWGAHAGYTHVWNPDFRSNLVGAYTWVVDPKIGGAKATDGVQKDFIQLFVNSFYSVAKNVDVGVEYAFGQWRSFTNGTPELKGTQHRVNASFHYNFY
jgi:hypothetical protein